MNKTRITIKPVEQREDMEACLGELARHTIQRDGLNAEMELRINEIRKKYEGKIESFSEKIEVCTEVLKDWAERHPDQFGKKKSIETVHGSVGFRFGQPQVKTKLKLTWAIVLEKIKALSLNAKYVRVKEEANKEAILADRDKKLNGPHGEYTIEDLGVRIVQDEAFFIEIKREPVGEPVAKAA